MKLISTNLEEGDHNIIWDGLNGAGHSVSSGIYFFSLETLE